MADLSDSGRWQYQAADRDLAAIESYLERFEGDTRPHVPMLVRSAREALAGVRDHLEDGRRLVGAANRAASRELSEGDLHHLALLGRNAEPELAICWFASLHQWLLLLQVADELPEDELQAFSDRLSLDDGITLGVLELARTPEQRAGLFARALSYSTLQTEKAKKAAAARWGGDTRVAVRDIVTSLAKQRDELGDWIKPAELWPQFWDRLDSAGLAPVDHGDAYAYHGGRYRYGAFRKEVERLHGGAEDQR